MHYCPANQSFTEVWVDNEVPKYFMETISSVIIFSFITISGGIEYVIYKRYSTNVDRQLVKKSSLYTLQVTICVFLSVLAAIRFFLQLTVINPGVISGYLILNFVLPLVFWPFSVTLILLESYKELPNTQTSRHGFILLVFWTLTFINENLAFLNLNKKFWWFSDSNKSDEIEFPIFIVRYICISLVLFLGLKAPGLPTYLAHSNGIEDKTRNLVESNTNNNFLRKVKLLAAFIWPKKNLLLQFQVLLCLILLVGGRVISIYLPIISKDIIDSLTDAAGKKLTLRWDYILIYVGFWFLHGQGEGSFIGNLISLLWIRVEQYSFKETQVKIYSHLLNLSLRWHNTRKTGEVLRIMDRGTSSVASLLNYLLFSLFPTLADILIAIVFFVTAFNAWFGLIVFLAMGLYAIVSVIVTEWSTKLRRDTNKSGDNLEAKAVDALLNFETVKNFNAEKYEIENYTRLFHDYQTREWKSTASSTLLSTLQSMTIALTVLTGTLLCANMVVNRDDLTVGDYVLFTTYLFQLYTPLSFFGSDYRYVQSSFIDMEKMFDLLGVVPEIQDDPNAQQLKVSGANLTFEKVTFSYNADRIILKNISFEVPSGKTVALVGPSGAGKSTIMRLIFRLYDTTSGKILFDNQDIKLVTQESLRNSIGVVPQDTVLFNDTLKYNIRYGRVDASENEIEDAAKAADIHKQITAFPEGYETIVGERGVKLSGGEKQRVAIARTILKNPCVVLLDEATSALDTNTERNIQSALNKMCANRTTVIVAHRLSTIIHADNILVLKDGEIVERGRHKDLLNKNGLYASMWQQQQDEREEGEGETEDC